MTTPNNGGAASQLSRYTSAMALRRSRVVSAAAGGGVRDPDPTIRITSFGGNCPVQAEGTVGGLPFYFRARGSAWALNVGGEEVVLNPAWRYSEDYGDEEYAAGWMAQYEALGFIAKALGLYVRDSRAALSNIEGGK